MSKLINWFVDRLIAFALRTPYFHLPGYMNRYWLIPFSPYFCAIRIHEILRSDDDRAFHDHPWPYLTIILRGGYFEVKPIFNKSGIYQGDSRKWYGPGSVLYRRSCSWHRLEVPEGKTVWTLFTTFRHVQKWGFLISPAYKQSNDEYLNQPEI